MKNLNPIFILFFSFLLMVNSSCGTGPIQNRRPAGLNLKTCQKLISDLMRGRHGHVESLESIKLDLKQRNILDHDYADRFLKNELYQRLVLKHENIDNIEKSVLILALIKKRNPQFTPQKVAQRYQSLFHTCGI